MELLELGSGLLRGQVLEVERLEFLDDDLAPYAEEVELVLAVFGGLAHMLFLKPRKHLLGPRDLAVLFCIKEALSRLDMYQSDQVAEEFTDFNSAFIKLNRSSKL